MTTTFRNTLIGLGITTILGLTAYLGGTQDYLTYQEYQDIIKAYNVKIDWIKANCAVDTRCVEENGVKKIIIVGAKNQKNIVKQLNIWINRSDLYYDKLAI